MKKLYILRHAKSASPSNIDDHERPLNKRGEDACKLIGKYLKSNNIVPEGILCSTALRTKSTIKNILREAGFDKDVEFNKKLYLATAGEILKELAKADDDINSVMIICHNPGVQHLALVLFGGGDLEAAKKIKEKYSTAAMAEFSFQVDSWKNITPGSGHLEKYITPKMLGQI